VAAHPRAGASAYWPVRDLISARPDAGLFFATIAMLPRNAQTLSISPKRPATTSGLELVRPESYVVNTARGEVIDENALTRLIENGEIAGAGLDVFEHEPAVNPKLVRLARSGKVVLLPHLGPATLEGRIDMGTKVIINISWTGIGRPTGCCRQCCEANSSPASSIHQFIVGRGLIKAQPQHD
jgi:hypothetical protein